jgi:mannose/fructose/N-acetylgalactosamine-specific phosphotransferase system component IIB
MDQPINVCKEKVMLRYVKCPKLYELSPTNSQLLRRCVQAFLALTLLVAVIALEFGGHSVAAAQAPPAKGSRIAVLPLDLQGEAGHHTGVIHDAIRHVLQSAQPAQLDFYFSREYIQKGSHKFDIHLKKIWNKKGFFSSKIEPNTGYVSDLGKALEVDVILMYSYYVGTNATDYIHVYLIDVRQRKAYYANGRTESFDHVFSGKREGFSETVRLTQIVLADYEQYRLPSDSIVVQRDEPERPQPLPAQPPVQDPAEPASRQSGGREEAPTPPVDVAADVEKRHTLTVRVTPPDSTVEMLHEDLTYRPGMSLAPGQYDLRISRQGYDPVHQSVRIDQDDVLVDVALTPSTYALTVSAVPADSRVTILNSATPYQPGVELPAGRYEVLVEREGYSAQRRTVILQDRDLSFSVALERHGYALSVNVTPPDSTVELLDQDVVYQPGMILAPGRYRLDVKRRGYKPVRQTVRIRNADVTLDVALQPETYALTVRATPADSRIRLLNTDTPYRPGVALPAGRYEVLVERDGYQAQRRSVMLEDRDVALPVALTRHAYALRVEATPADSRIRLLNLQSEYVPGMALPPGQYHVEVAKEGYVTQRAWATIGNSDTTLEVALAPVQYALYVQVEPADSTITLLDSDTPYRPGVLLAPGMYKLRITRDGYRSQERAVTIRDQAVSLDVSLDPIAVARADTEPPVIEVTSHHTSGVMEVPATVTRTTIRGYATDPSGVTEVVVNGTKALLDGQGKFSAEIVLAEGRNDILVTAMDAHRNIATTGFAIERAAGFDMARRRTALVFGNAAYTMAPLRNPGNDAVDMAAKLENLGFKVMLHLDATRRQMEDAVEAFSRELRQGGVGLMYYAGHGVQVDGQNYLIPLDARLEQAVDVKYQTIPAGWIIERMENAGNELNIVVLDACRDNPFSRSWRSIYRGLAGIQAARGTLIAYATEPGGVAQDGSDRNGIYTKYLLEYIAEPGWTVERVFKQVRIAVVNETRGKQIPWESSSLLGDFYFVQP